MVEALKALSSIVDLFHDLLADIILKFGWNLTDKQLHFWIIGIIGILIFLFTDLSFKALARLNISIISFAYTFTVLIVIVFAIEIQQKITGSGNMEFGDVVAGLWGFLWLFGIYLLYKGIIILIKKLLKTIKKAKTP
ncbi:hypothetical protein NSA47_11990 [Irregularibacter muris]|uniref:Uncharacterized protein n=1 Tax=Irregularibacter muris TaxID=1796619 RepID=A0AAE3HFM9_9FIRM|nr:hypothetical protein [Irregularibacter muris]MCR1899697.1 hypothetical protein [Irregularibacter muris]